MEILEKTCALTRFGRCVSSQKKTVFLRQQRIPPLLHPWARSAPLLVHHLLHVCRSALARSVENGESWVALFLRFHPTEKKHRKKSWDEMMKRCGVQFGCKSKPFVQRHQCFYPMELVVRDDFHCRVVCCLPFMEVVRFSEKCQWNEGQLFSGPSLCHFHTHQEENSYSC